MSDLGTVDSYAAGAVPTAYVTLTEADAGEGDVYQPAGLDAPPLPGDTCACMAITDGTGEFAIVAFSGPEGKAAPGETRVFSRDTAGTVKAEAWLRGDGTITLEAGVDQPVRPSLTLSPDGTLTGSYLGWSFEFDPAGGLSITALAGVTLNGVSIDALGNLSATTVGSLLNDLDTHIHNQTVPPGPPPVPTTPPVPTP